MEPDARVGCHVKVVVYGGAPIEVTQNIGAPTVCCGCDPNGFEDVCVKEVVPCAGVYGMCYEIGDGEVDSINVNKAVNEAT